MTDEAAFLQSLQDDPDDPYNRLVFADWLEEQGDPRGELLRLTHVLTQAIKIPDRAELETRLQRLVDEGVQAVGPFWRNSVDMKFAWIPAGTFKMGSPALEHGRFDDEPQQVVTLAKGFWMGVVPVRRNQWRAVIDGKSGRAQDNDLPITDCDWNECIQFCKKLGKNEGRKYRLPTEGEWEYACRAGTTTAYHFGEVSKLEEYAWHNVGGRNTLLANPQPVGLKKPNAWGLFDMHGNVWEWCWEIDRVGSQTDPTDGMRVLRGGSLINMPWFLRSAARSRITQRSKGRNYGVRVCLDKV